MTRADRSDYLLCGAIIVGAVLAVAILALFAQRIDSARPPISNDSTYEQVVANFAGKPYSTGQFVTGYVCAGYTAGKDGHGWVVIRCQK